MFLRGEEGAILLSPVSRQYLDFVTYLNGDRLSQTVRKRTPPGFKVRLPDHLVTTVLCKRKWNPKKR